ncbi:nicotinate-nucleotide adenylyltransferase [Rubrivirga marina]|uniref:Probable nicotinate-nucleotide adenylyltransferase n=1 Tax=Rubrivirga marina TaxID=1196024 RepID=A0A271J1T3_9BACT|nr:nicotinate-nucleotide adenylyltransferase [Rubrivirga marina]PAP77004.1 nicotinate (nicotinamide) nucleotide adenylyltransferase [Rubrivirga marina]
MPTGLFGGSFNPPHVGHLAVAEACAEAAGLDRVLWMPAATPPHKQGDPALAPAEARLRMVEAAIAGNDRFVVSDLEIARGDVSYTVDTLRRLHDDGLGGLALILGGDSLAGFPGWREPEAIVGLARLVVYRRPGDRVDLGALPEWIGGRCTVVDGPALDVSSTELRGRIAAGRTVRYLVPDEVRGVIEAEGWYRPGGGSAGIGGAG